MDQRRDSLDEEVDKNEGKKVKSLAEVVSDLKEYQEAGAHLLRNGPGGLRLVEKTRKRHFVRHGEAGANRAIEIRGKHTAAAGERTEHQEEESRRRRMHMQTSALMDRGCLSKFGEGDGSFWDRWLTNTKFEGETGCFEHIGGDPMKVDSHIVPHTGNKQWFKPAAELVHLEKKRWKSHDGISLHARESDAFKAVHAHVPQSPVAVQSPVKKKSRPAAVED